MFWFLWKYIYVKLNFKINVSIVLKFKIIIKIHALYRNSAASFEKAQAEFATTMMSNKNVQNAAKEVFTETAKASLKQGRF